MIQLERTRKEESARRQVYGDGEARAVGLYANWCMARILSSGETKGGHSTGFFISENGFSSPPAMFPEPGSGMSTRHVDWI